MERTYIRTAGQFGDEDDGNDEAYNNIAVDGEFYPLEHHRQYCVAARAEGQVPEIEERPSFGVMTRVLILLGTGLSVRKRCGVCEPAFTIPARQDRSCQAIWGCYPKAQPHPMVTPWRASDCRP